MRIAMVGHVEHITLGRVPAVPRAGDIAHLQGPRSFPGGGGGIAFFQLTRSNAEILLYTALGNDEAAAHVRDRVARTAARVFAAHREQPHTRDLVMITPDGERTIVVVGEPLHPVRADPLPWEALASCDAAYFTAEDPAAIPAARAARVLGITARRRPALLRSGVRADVVVGSAVDPRGAATLADFPPPQRPSALVLTEGAAGGSGPTEAGSPRVPAPPRAPESGGADGGGGSVSGAPTYLLPPGGSVLP